MTGGDGSSLTRRGWSLFGAALGLLVGSRLLGAVELAMLAVAALALIAASLAWAMRATVRLRAGRTVRPQRTMIGEDVRVDLAIENGGARRTPMVAIADLFADGRRAARFTLGPLPPGERAAAAYRVPTQRRGRFAIGPLQVVAYDPFGLVRRRATLLAPDELLVRPRVRPLRVPPLAGGTSSSRPGDARSLLGEGEEFRALREYAQGDDLRRVHWRSSARLDQLMIRQHEAHRQARAVVLLDVRPRHHDESSFERAVEAAASAAFHLGRSRRDVEVVLSSGVRLRGSTDAILDHLAVVEPVGTADALPTLGRSKERILTVVVTATVDEEIGLRLVDLATRGPVIAVTTAAPGVDVPATCLVDARHDLTDAWDRALTSAAPRSWGARVVAAPSTTVGPQ